jgi:hypothetical protein
MICANLLQNFGYDCAPRPDGALRIWAPFTFDDGEHLGVYVEPNGDGQWLVTDHADTLMHASAQGAELKSSRINLLRKKFNAVDLSKGGEISIVSSEEDLPAAVTAVLNMAISITHLEDSWRPQVYEEKFISTVGKELESVVGNKLHRKAIVTGVSGHQIEFPFAIDDPDAGRQYIQPVAYGNDHVAWANVYKTHGKMSDIKSAGAEDKQRIVIIEDALSDAEIGKAITLLSLAATVLLYSHRAQWLPRFQKGALNLAAT